MHALEMIALDKSLTYDDNFWTKMIIKFSNHLSDFGQSFHKPLIALFFGHFLLFLILIISKGFPNLYISFNPTLSGLTEGIFQYFRLLNPARDFEESTFKGYRILIDIIMRIWSSYMIYNIIRATRRFIK